MKKNTSLINDTFNKHLDESPLLLRKFILHLITIEGKPTSTAEEYFFDLMRFFKYIIDKKGLKSPAEEDEAPTLLPADETSEIVKESEIAKIVDENFCRAIVRDDIINYLFYLQNDLNNTAVTRNRGLSVIKSFYKYLEVNIHIVEVNPVASINSAKKKKQLPKYLNVEECNLLLDNLQSTYYERDYCILTIFLNTGVRLSELVGMNCSDIKSKTIRINGKGNKERTVYLNNACIASLKAYMDTRTLLCKHEIVDKDALFIAYNTGKRLTGRWVEQIVSKALKCAGLDGKGYSPHKLRHTAATLMYQEGVDVNTLKDVLGHESLSTTQIYTHTNNKQLRAAINKNPLANKCNHK